MDKVKLLDTDTYASSNYIIPKEEFQRNIRDHIDQLRSSLIPEIWKKINNNKNKTIC